MRLYDYTLQMLKLEALLEEESVSMEAFLDAYEHVQGEADEKAENVARMMDNFNAQIEALKSEEKKLSTRRKTIENNMIRLTESLEMYLQSLNKDKHQVGMYKLGYRKLPASVEIWDEDAIPKAYRIPQPDKISKTDIAKALKDGEVVDGAELRTDGRKFVVKK